MVKREPWDAGRATFEAERYQMSRFLCLAWAATELPGDCVFVSHPSREAASDRYKCTARQAAQLIRACSGAPTHFVARAARAHVDRSRTPLLSPEGHPYLHPCICHRANPSHLADAKTNLAAPRRIRTGGRSRWVGFESPVDPDFDSEGRSFT